MQTKTSYKTLLYSFDWINFFLVIALVCMGLLFVYSATYHATGEFSFYFKKQLLGALVGIILYMLVSMQDLRTFTPIGAVAYGGTLLLLCYTILAGFVGMGARRWISLYFFRIQPSELVRIFFPFFVAWYFQKQQATVKTGELQEAPKNLSFYKLPLIMLGLTVILLARQPDLGTALIILFSGLTLLWFIGLPRRFFLYMSFILISIIPVGDKLWPLLKPYQQKRILVFCGYGDKKKERYQIEQSMIAVGSGGITGKGFLRGTQSKLQFLPEDHTDFIFAVVCEELGLLGALTILILYILLFIRSLYVIAMLKSLTYQIIGLGLIIHIIFSVIINIGMVVGLLPVVGISLPLISYGLCNLWVTLVSFGWLNNLSTRRNYYR